MTNSFNDIRNAKTQIIMGGNPAEAIRYHCSTARGQGAQRANFIVIDPRLTRTAAHATEYVRMRPGTDIPVLYGMMWHILPERLGGQGVHQTARLRFRRSPQGSREVESGRSRTRHAASPAEQLKRVAKMFATEKPSTLIWAMGQTQTRPAPPTCGRAASALLLTGNVGKPGTGANIFRGHEQRAGSDRRRARYRHAAVLLRPRRRARGGIGRGFGRSTMTT